MHNLHHRGMLQWYSPAERLPVVMDNFSGKNKNNHIFHLAAYLLKMKFSCSIEFIFFVLGHTKNARDRLFNQMMIRFHEDQVHSYHVALDILNIQLNVAIIDVTEDMFKDFGNMLD
jgi:hypothetical protein